MTSSIAGPLLATLIGCFDGDTCKMQVEVWPDVVVTTQVRVRGIDAPEMSGKCPQEKALAEAARDALSDLLAHSSVISLANIAQDKYGGRIVADVWADATLAGAVLVGLGLARPYSGGARRGWCG